MSFFKKIFSRFLFFKKKMSTCRENQKRTPIEKKSQRKIRHVGRVVGCRMVLVVVVVGRATAIPAD
jgi:hypothetical protein